ncbi:MULTISPECIES: hypothetical protein [Clostridium]|jgi:hypothetical protein|uniref:hypothetical protein n=1 Tax=Clostridium TaxID=1485 RepID=UPI000D8A047C|nr:MULTISPECIES: hypothetical protein [Clostridium]DAR10719.1 MAG TPA: hypothetical protein [Caudoviricetes sp.]MDU1822568.1 hypothetical protein [Clostridium sp.]MDU1841733.1 hypothetical protein [Clostridium sp.]MDU2689454.1 hypothetical protein [Clostridium sp.]MDU2955637.1 hypothetical protein [Clostridium sp.]
MKMYIASTTPIELKVNSYEIIDETETTYTIDLEEFTHIIKKESMYNTCCGLTEEDAIESLKAKIQEDIKMTKEKLRYLESQLDIANGGFGI